MLLRAMRSRSCAVCRHPIAKGELAYHWPGAHPVRPYRCMRCGEWPEVLADQYDVELLQRNREAARSMMAWIRDAPGYAPPARPPAPEPRRPSEGKR